MTRMAVLLTLAGTVGFLAIAGCSELGIISKAAVRELRSDAINVERASYQSPVKTEEKTTVAQVMTTDQQAQKLAAPRKKVKEQKRGLWEGKGQQ